MGILRIKGCWRLKVPLELTLSNLPWAKTRPHHSKFHSPWGVLKLSKEGDSVTSLGKLPQRSCETSQSAMAPLMLAAFSPSPVHSWHDDLCHGSQDPQYNWKEEWLYHKMPLFTHSKRKSPLSSSAWKLTHCKAEPQTWEISSTDSPVS